MMAEMRLRNKEGEMVFAVLRTMRDDEKKYMVLTPDDAWLQDVLILEDLDDELSPVRLENPYASVSVEKQEELFEKFKKAEKVDLLYKNTKVAGRIARIMEEFEEQITCIDWLDFQVVDAVEMEGKMILVTSILENGVHKDLMIWSVRQKATGRYGFEPMCSEIICEAYKNEETRRFYINYWRILRGWM